MTIELTEHELESVLWRKIEKYADDRISLLRAKNDGRLGPDETAWVRGQIFELKALLGLGAPPLLIDE